MTSLAILGILGGIGALGFGGAFLSLGIASLVLGIGAWASRPGPRR